MIKEDFLHYLWKLKKFDLSGLTTSKGQKVVILDFGTHNTDSGPDFFNAKIKIDNTIWVGNVEIHVNSSDWLKHNHQYDKAYNNVILHVVYNNDTDVKTESNITPPTLELKNRIKQNDLKNYKLLRFNNNWVPCEKLFSAVPSIPQISALEKTLTDRLITKSHKLEIVLEKKNFDWEEAFYIYLSRFFGMKTNSDAFEMLSNSIPYKILLKEKDSLTKVEALLFGQAGLLNEEFVDEYPNRLKTEFLHLNTKYKLGPLPKSLWKFSKLRPANFPTIRIAQLAKLLYNNTHLFSKILESDNTKAIKKLLETKLDGYWQNHFVFDKKSINRKKTLGKSTLDIILINSIIPTLFLYGKIKNEQKYKQRAIDFLTEISPEKNSIINKWKNLGFNVQSAFDTQALLELKSNYCDNYRCLECPIGNYIMNN